MGYASRMARRAFLPTVPPPSSPPSQRTAPPSSESPLSEGRISSVPGTDGIAGVVVAPLLDRLLAADEGHFVVSWIEGLSDARTRSRNDPAMAVRLLRAYRETDRHDRARDLAAALPAALAGSPVDSARLSIERAFIALGDRRADLAEAELRLASRFLSTAPRGAGLREQLDIHLAATELEVRHGRVARAQAALRLAEHVADRLEEAPWRATVAVTLGHLAMRLSDPRAAAKHYASALTRSPARSHAALRAQGNLAIAQGSIGRFEEARLNAHVACGLAGEIAAGWRQADAYDIVSIVEIAADRPLAALTAIDDAHTALGDVDRPLLRWQLAVHRTWALAVLGRAPSAAQWLSRAEKLARELGDLDPVDAQELVATQARTLESAGHARDVLAVAALYAERVPDAYVTGVLNLVVGRAALGLGEIDVARSAVERAALSGDEHGWIYPERAATQPLWELGVKSGDSRVVRYAERIIAFIATGHAPSPSATIPPPSRGSFPSIPPLPYTEDEASLDSREAESLIYVTTPAGVTRVKATDVRQASLGASLVVDTIAHALRVDDREVSIERRRALEPLVVQLLRRAREGLSAEEILRAAGGPGPESADAEHRVRVLISRVRDLLGDPALIERVRDAGEHGKTRYRLAPGLRFALIEPLQAAPVA